MPRWSRECRPSVVGLCLGGCCDGICDSCSRSSLWWRLWVGLRLRTLILLPDGVRVARVRYVFGMASWIVNLIVAGTAIGIGAIGTQLIGEASKVKPIALKVRKGRQR